VILGLQAASIGELVHGMPSALLVGVAVCCSRAALSLICLRGVPAARGDGLGVAVAGAVPRLAKLACWLVVSLIMTAATAWSGQGATAGVLATAASASAVGVLVYRCVRRLGGVTGDVMGAGIEIAFTVMIIVMIV